MAAPVQRSNTGHYYASEGSSSSDQQRLIRDGLHGLVHQGPVSYELEGLIRQIQRMDVALLPCFSIDALKGEITVTVTNSK